MKIFNKILEFINSYFLGKRIRHRKRPANFSNFQTSKSISVLFDASTKEKHNEIKDYIKFLNKKNKKVYGLGYVTDKEVIASYIYDKEINYFSLQDISVIGKMKNETITDFINKPVDILLNLCLEEQKSLNYIMSASKANMKISGKTDDKYADLIIQVGAKKDVQYLITQINHYLETIKV